MAATFGLTLIMCSASFEGEKRTGVMDSNFSDEKLVDEDNDNEMLWNDDNHNLVVESPKSL